MKKLNFLLALILIGAVCFSCQKTEQETEQAAISTDINVIQDPAADFEKFSQRLDARLASLSLYKEQLAQAGYSNRECMERVVVPTDAPTIQDAIELVCDYGEVIVQSGTYAESIWIYNKPGIHIRAVGNVIIDGDIAVTDNSDNVIIEGFNIVLPDYPFYWDAIWLYYVSGCVIKNNIISNQAYPGIDPDDSGISLTDAANDNHIKDNEVSGMQYGILMGNLNLDETTSNNKIMGNLISYVDRGIWLVFDCDDNMVMGNQINNSEGPVSIGISMTGIDFFGTQFFIENNKIKHNEVSYCDLDGLLMAHAYDNMIGPNNTFDNNGRHGISLLLNTSKNFVVNNDALNNAGFDIYNEGVNNKFRANTAVNTFGL